MVIAQETEGPSVTPEISNQIAELLNARNQLTIKYDGPRVLRSAAHYHWEIGTTGEVIACAELKPVQWYQREICHLTVTANAPRQGLGERLARRCEELAVKDGASILQCTIREGNVESTGLFKKIGFQKVGVFFNSESRRNVGVWQKVLSASIQSVED
jgi:ribosomal protein S18 acetylase RimI-like enzyme